MFKSQPNCIAYLLNTYPYTSTTFIRREIRELENQGMCIKRFSIRKWNDTLVEESDVLEQEKTEYILTGKNTLLIWHFLVFLLTHPIKLLSIIPLWSKLLHNSGYRIVKHTAYLLESTYFASLLKQQELSHIHCHYSNNACSVALLTSELSGSTFSFTVHGPDELDRVHENSLSLKVNYAKFVVAISNYCKSQILRHCNSSEDQKIKIIRCGINTEYYAPIDSKLLVSENQLVCIGRLCRQKNQLLLVEAMSEVLKSYPDTQLLLIGDGPERVHIEELIRKNSLQKSIKLLGWLDEESVRAYLAKSKALILPSSAEGLPIVIMESMASKTPVLSTYIAGIPELINHEKNGWLVPACDKGSLTSQISHLLEASEQEMQEISHLAFEKVREMHELSVSIRKLRNYLIE